MHSLIVTATPTEIIPNTHFATLANTPTVERTELVLFRAHGSSFTYSSRTLSNHPFRDLVHIRGLSSFTPAVYFHGVHKNSKNRRYEHRLIMRLSYAICLHQLRRLIPARAIILFRSTIHFMFV